MEIIKPQVELWIQENPIDHVARCARICYASDKTTGNIAMYNRLQSSNHMSMFRHESIYMIAPGKSDTYDLISRFEDCPFVDYRIDYDNDEIYVSTNRQFFIENESIRYFGEWIVEPAEFANTLLGKEIMRYTFKVVTQISTSRELNRVSPNNIAEQSTRYVNLNKKGGAICQPWWLKDEIVNYINSKLTINLTLEEQNEYVKEIHYLKECSRSFATYRFLTNECGMTPQDARGVLPLDTATVCIYTYSISEWRHIIDLRYYGTTGAPHPNAKIIAGMIRDELIKLGYEFR
jgi:thymidylate synthase (FAD)